MEITEVCYMWDEEVKRGHCDIKKNTKIEDENGKMKPTVVIEHLYNPDYLETIFRHVFMYLCYRMENNWMPVPLGASKDTKVLEKSVPERLASINEEVADSYKTGVDIGILSLRFREQIYL